MNAGRSPTEQTFDASPRAASASRRFVADQLRARGASDDVVADFMLAVSELVTNAVQHGAGGQVVVSVDTAQPNIWQVRVETPTPLPAHLRSPAQWAMGASSAASGRGLGIVREVMDEVLLDAEGAVVSLRRHRD